MALLSKLNSLKAPVPKAPKKKKKEFNIGIYDYGDFSLRYGEDAIFIADAYAPQSACCGFHEMSGFDFPEYDSYDEPLKVEYCEGLQKAFNEYVNHATFDDQGFPAIRMLVLNRPRKSEKANQPDWFIQCLENYPGSSCLDWTHNTNTGVTDIKPYFLPVIRPANFNAQNARRRQSRY